jgi:hypothetical protein
MYSNSVRLAGTGSDAGSGSGIPVSGIRHPVQACSHRSPVLPVSTHAGNPPVPDAAFRTARDTPGKSTRQDSKHACYLGFLKVTSQA